MVVVAAVALLAIGAGALLLLSDDSADEGVEELESNRLDPTTAAPPPDEPLDGPDRRVRVELEPVGESTASGFALVGRRGDRGDEITIQGKLPPLQTGGVAYEVWLYNSPEDAFSLGGQQPDPDGNFGGTGPLPADWKRWQFIDVSLESLSEGEKQHSGASVARGRLP